MSVNRPLKRCVRCTRHDRILYHAARTLTTTTEPPSASETPPPPSEDATAKPARRYNPNLVYTTRSERKLIETQNEYPIGSRRRRAALATSTNIPFSELPYQCFQEARKILQSDRAEKVREIQTLRERVAKLEVEGTLTEQLKAKAMKDRMEKLKVWADINDPLVKKRFEDGLGDMNKPIYRHLADLKWRDYERKVLMQRITQMNVIPDVLPTIDPIYSTTIRFGSNPKTAHGEIVHSTTSEHPPVLAIQPYDKGERLITIAVVNPDMPNVEKDGFDYRCHFLASNIKLSPIQTKVDLGALDLEAQVLLPWLPPHVQKGLPYQRHAIFILEQGAASSDGNPKALLDLQKIRQAEVQGTKREGFLMKDFVEQFNLLPRGVDLFRAVWDDGTRGVMERAGIVGGDVEFKRKRVEPLPYQRLKGERFR